MVEDQQNEYVVEEDIDFVPSMDAIVTMPYDVEIFNELRDFPCIWDTSCRSYRDQEMKKVAWEDLRKTFNKNGR